MGKEGRVSYVENLSGFLGGQSFILVDYSGVVTADIDKIRSGVQSLGGVCKIVRNRLFRKSLDDMGISLDANCFVGMNMLVKCSSERFFEVSKVVLDSEKASKGKIKSGLYDGGAVDAVFVKKMAMIPSKDILYSLLVGALLSPLSRLIFVLQSVAESKTQEKQVM